MVQINSISLTLSMLCLNTFAQTETRKTNFSFSGSVDTYYTSNLYKNSVGSIGILSDTKANGFGLGMVNAIITYDKDRIGVVADLAFGPRANSANAYDGAINQLYVYYEPINNLKFTLGQFNTFFGYEVISPIVNFNYTVSYLFMAGPFSHTGLKIDYIFSNDINFMIALTNAHGITSGSNISNSFQAGFQLGYKNQYLNLVYGSDGFGANDAFLIDYTSGFDFSNSFYIGINAAYSNSKNTNTGYRGVALYFQKQFKNKISVGFRPEFFTTTSSAGNKSQVAYTLTAKKNLLDDLSLTTELRYDTSKDITFFNRSNMTGITVAAIYSFK